MHYVDYGNSEAVPLSDIQITEVLPNIPPQAVGMKFPCLESDAVTADLLNQLSQLLLDQQIVVEVKGESGDGYLIASCDFVDQWMAKETGGQHNTQ